MPKIIRATGASLVSTLLLASTSAAMAGTYDALCAGVECKIVLDAKGFSGPAGFMPAHRIAQWYTGGGEENNAAASAAGATGGAIGGALVGGLATCWTIILCPFGLIGGGVAGGMGGSRAGRSADFYFTVIGYNQEGSKITQSFNFINKKPAGRMIQELPVISGLGMGEMRTIEQIKEADQRAETSGSGKPQLPASIGTVQKGSASTLPANLGSSTTTTTTNNSKSCWSNYLKTPGMQTWARTHPQAAEKQKAKFNDC
jgi:hypothetical protein